MTATAPEPVSDFDQVSRLLQTFRRLTEANTPTRTLKNLCLAVKEYGEVEEVCVHSSVQGK